MFVLPQLKLLTFKAEYVIVLQRIEFRLVVLTFLVGLKTILEMDTRSSNKKMSC